jgi:malonate-semialdehyde dehydrogenase (acetylating)/methylmalonate-semialdehyde dehydrogenase
MIVKPSEQVPLSQHKMATLIDRLKLPPGVVNYVNGGKPVVNAILEHRGIQGVSFVGSSPVAQHVYETGSRHGKRVQALGGAKNFIVVMDDCDWGKAIPNLVESCYGCAGQRCLAGSTVIAVGKAYQTVRDRLIEGAKAVKVGYGMEPGVTMGPVISKAHKDKVLGLIETGIKEGARLALDGRGVSVPNHPKGHWVGPTLFDEVNPTMTVAQQEIFGPVMCVLRAGSLDEALATIEAHPLANASSIYTSNGAHARTFVKRVPAAMVGVNIGVAAPMAFFTFGGAKGSFFGDLKAHGRDSIAFYTDNKTAISRWW